MEELYEERKVVAINLGQSLCSVGKLLCLCFCLELRKRYTGVDLPVYIRIYNNEVLSYIDLLPLLRLNM